MAPVPHIVIVGGGFGGIETAKHLGDALAAVTVIDRRNFHLFQPLLYQVATGGLSPGDISSPLRHVLRNHRNTTVLMGEVTDVDPARKLIRVADANISYDYLVLATGSTHDYFGHPEWAARAPGLKTIEDAIDIRSRIFRAFEDAEWADGAEARKKYMRFVIVGGGATGVELAGAIAEIAFETLKRDFRRIHTGDAEIILVEGSDRVLGTYPPLLSRKVREALERMGVRVITGRYASQVDDDGVVIGSGEAAERIAAKTVLWAAGVRASGLGKLVAGNPADVDRAGRIRVEPDLTVPGRPEIYVIGDLALFTHQGKTPLPGIAPVAMSEGRYVAKAIKHRLEGKPHKAYRYFNKGVLATIGRAKAVADFGKIKVWGYPAWLLWLFVHLMYLVEFENRLLVFFQWAWSYLTRNRGARLITFELSERRSQEQETEVVQRR